MDILRTIVVYHGCFKRASLWRLPIVDLIWVILGKTDKFYSSVNKTFTFDQSGDIRAIPTASSKEDIDTQPKISPKRLLSQVN